MNVFLRRVCRRFLKFLQLARSGPQRRANRSARPPQLERLEAREVLAGTWTNLASLAPASIGTMMLLTDGTVMAQGGGQTSAWYKLTPNAAGSYQSGTWSARASMNFTRLYYGSNVLPDGRVFLVGGEYSSAGSFTNTGEIYNPLTNTWSPTANFPLSQFGDDPTMLLPDGRVLGGHLSDGQTYLYNPTTNTWTFAANKLRGDRSDEETWMLLPDNSVLSYDIFNLGHGQRYVPSTNTWVDTGPAPNNLSSSTLGSELGPAFLLPDGRAFFIGASGHTAYYTLSTNTWTSGPDVPGGLGADDAPGAMLPNGKILFAADTPLFHGPTKIFEFNPSTNTYTDVTPSSSILGLTGPSYTDRMLVLPTGQVLVTTGANKLALYTPDLAPNPAWKPTISSIVSNVDDSYTLTGTQLNGISQGASYGDDAEMDSNYPIVRFTNDAATAVYYARSFGWTPGVATGSTLVTTQFSLPASLPAGHYNVQVIANGIASNTFGFQYTPVADPGFELPNVGAGGYQYNPLGSPWLFTGGAGVSGNGSDFTDGNPNAPQRNQVAFLQGAGSSISQSVTFAAGAYNISFSAAQRGDAFQGSSQTFQVLIDNTVVGTFTPGSTSYAVYSTSSMAVTAGVHSIQFFGLDPDNLDNTAFLDEVRINQVQAVSIISDPGFELPNVGAGNFQYNPLGSPWTFTGGAGVSGNGSDFTYFNPNAPQGNQVAFLQSSGSSISQSVNFAAGTYTLNFSAAQRFYNDSSQTFVVMIDNTVVGTFTPYDTNYDVYHTNSFTVTAGAHTISFVGIDPDGLDNTVFIDQLLLTR